MSLRKSLNLSHIYRISNLHYLPHYISCLIMTVWSFNFVYQTTKHKKFNNKPGLCLVILRKKLLKLFRLVQTYLRSHLYMNNFHLLK